MKMLENSDKTVFCDLFSAFWGHTLTFDFINLVLNFMHIYLGVDRLYKVNGKCLLEIKNGVDRIVGTVIYTYCVNKSSGEVTA